MAATSRLGDYVLQEALHAPRRAPLAMAIGGALTVLGAHALLVRFPAAALRFLEQAFRIEGIAAILLINDLLAAYFVTYFVGLAGLLAATVTAREENQLEILLAKPLRARVLLAARVSPVLLSAAAAGVVVSVVIALAVRPHVRSSDMVSTAGALGSSLVFVGLALALLTALLPLLVRMRDGFHALLVGVVVWLAPVLPTAFFIYRPDLFGAAGRHGSVVVLPALLWHDATSAWLGPLTLGAAIPFGAAMVALAGVALERTDAR